MKNIAQNIEDLKEKLPQDVTLVAVSKTKPNEAILEAYQAGQRVFGENKVQDMCDKAEVLPKDIQWHMIGHLQRNKIKYMASFVSLIHGVDSVKTVKEIQKQAKKHNRIIEILLQVKIASEESKFGIPIDTLDMFFKELSVIDTEHVRVRGFMGMATNTENEEQIQSEFSILNKIYREYHSNNPEINILSMGMSGDYPIAIKSGSNMIRVGSAIFGKRNYN